MGKTNRKAGKDKNEKDKHNSNNSMTTFNKKPDIDTKRSLRKRQNRQAYQYDSQEEKDLQNILNNMNLKVRVIKGDGNCMFRSIADQLVGDEHKYDKYRQIICDYIEEHEGKFELLSLVSYNIYLIIDIDTYINNLS